MEAWAAGESGLLLQAKKDVSDRLDICARRMITREDLISAERALYRVRHDMVYKRGELTRRLGGNDQRDGTSTDDQGWMSRVFDSTLGRNQGTLFFALKCQS